MKKGFWNKTILGTLLATSISSVFSFPNSKTAEAGYADNPNNVYYDLAKHVYDVTGSFTYDENQIEYLLNRTQPDDKFQVINAVNLDNNRNHPAGLSSSGDYYWENYTGFQAMAVVAPASKKLFIVFAGSKNFNDYNAAKNIIDYDTPGQEYQAQMFVNYIYQNSQFYQYRTYDWYFTGHSLGGWLAQKIYLDIRSANWLTSSDTWKYGGPIEKSIKGVYTFNALPIMKNSVPTTQWDANKSGVYNTNIKNLYINNEWLNSMKDMYPTYMDYFGTEGSVTTKNIPHYTTRGYNPSILTYDIYKYQDTYTDALQAHKISELADSITR